MKHLFSALALSLSLLAAAPAFAGAVFLWLAFFVLFGWYREGPKGI